MTEYLNRVLTYLKQELPKPYADKLTLDGTTFKFNVDGDGDFEALYRSVYDMTHQAINRTINRESDLYFSVWQYNQSRDFMIYK